MEKNLVLIIAIIFIAWYFFNANNNKLKAVENNKLAKEFLIANKSKAGVVETGSGLQYLVLTTGDGNEHPSATTNVKVHYHGTLLDGTVFDSSVDRNQPISFRLNQVIKGWTEGVQLMVIGEKTRFFIPSNLGYGNSPSGKIEPGSLLIFDVELLAIN